MHSSGDLIISRSLTYLWDSFAWLRMMMSHTEHWDNTQHYFRCTGASHWLKKTKILGSKRKKTTVGNHSFSMLESILSNRSPSYPTPAFLLATLLPQTNFHSFHMHGWPGQSLRVLADDIQLCWKTCEILFHLWHYEFFVLIFGYAFRHLMVLIKHQVSKLSGML